MIIALALVAGASLSIDAAKKKKVVKQQKPAVEAFSLKSVSDSISYTAGMSVGSSVIPFLLQQKVDTAYMADFVRGFQEAAKAEGDARQKAYLMGIQIANQVNERVLPGVKHDFEGSSDSIETAKFYRGFTDALLKDTSVCKVLDAESYYMVKTKVAKAVREEKLYGANRDAGKKFLADNAKKDGVVTLPSGLQYKVLKQGKGAVPTLSDKVMVNYEGRLIDGTVFDASKNHGDAPAEFRPTDVIKGWTEALTMMPVGSKWQLYIPAELAYGNREAGQIKPYSALIFDIELVGINGKTSTTGKNTKSQKKTKK